MTNKAKLLNAAFAGLMAAGTLGIAGTALAEDAKCYGVNSCKGQGKCGSKAEGHSCAGKNSCKGMGWIKVGDAEKNCIAKGGTLTEEETVVRMKLKKG